MEVGWRRKLLSDEIPDNHYDIYDPDLEYQEDTGEIDGLSLAMKSFHFWAEMWKSARARSETRMIGESDWIGLAMENQLV